MPGIIKKMKYQNEMLAICIFFTLLGICIFIFLLRKDAGELKEYAEAFSFQVSSMKLTKERIMLHIFCKRIFYLAIIFVLSIYFRSKKLINCFIALFFFIYGIFVSLNVCVLGIKGVMTGLVLVLPQWLLYFAVYYICMKHFIKTTHFSSLRNYLILFMLVMTIFLGVLIETYVTLPVIFKFII